MILEILGQQASWIMICCEISSGRDVSDKIKLDSDSSSEELSTAVFDCSFRQVLTEKFDFFPVILDVGVRKES